MEVGSGWFIQFKPDEKEDELALMKFLRDNEYECTGEGIKEMIMDTIYGDEPQKKNAILEAIQENPEAVKKTLETAGSLLGKVLNKKIFKK